MVNILRGSFHLGGAAKLRYLMKFHKLPSVYVLEADSFKYIKIGHTKNIKNRLSNLNSGCPFKLNLWLCIKTSMPREIELYLLKKYKEFNLKGEWFTLPDDKLDELMCFVKERNLIERSIFSGGN